MNRRDLIKLLAAAPFMPAFVSNALANVPHEPKPKAVTQHVVYFLDGEFMINFRTKKISRTDKPSQGRTVLEFHRALSSVLDAPECMPYPQPTLRLTDHLFKVINGYEISEEVFPTLSAGAITQGDDLWSSSFDWSE